MTNPNPPPARLGSDISFDVGDDGHSANKELAGVGASACRGFTRWNGATGSFSAVLNGQQIGRLDFGAAYDATHAARGANHAVLATEDWSATGHGCCHLFTATAIGTTTDVVVMDVDADEGVRFPLGKIDLSALPTTDPHDAGKAWNNGGVVTVSAG